MSDSAGQSPPPPAKEDQEEEEKVSLDKEEGAEDQESSKDNVVPGEENILDDLLHQNNDHENMFEEDEEAKKKEEEEKKAAADKVLEDIGAEPIGEHSDISDVDSNHEDDELLNNDDDDDDLDSKKENTDKNDGEEDKNGSKDPAGDGDEDSDKSSDSDSSDSDGDANMDDENDAKDDANKRKRIVKAPSKTREKIEAPSSSGDEKNAKDDSASTSADRPRKKGGKSYDYATKLNYLFREARFFLVKSNNAENVTLAKNKGVWSTPPANESRFNQAFDEARNVLLVYSVKESGKFTGLARLSTKSNREGPQVSWVLPPGLSARGTDRLVSRAATENTKLISFLSFSVSFHSVRWCLQNRLDLSQGAVLPKSPTSLQSLERGETCKNREGWTRNRPK